MYGYDADDDGADDATSRSHAAYTEVSIILLPLQGEYLLYSDPLDLIQRNFVAGVVIELDSVWAFVHGHELHIF